MVDKLNDTELYERIKLVLTGVFPNGVSPENITADTRLLEELNMDSIHIVDLVLGLEDAFGISIDDGVFAKIKTVGDIVILIKEKLA
jgi:acyl carrier protein